MATHLDTPTVRRFERLGRLGQHKVAKGMLDPRGWRVVDGHGQAVGEVKDLIVDTDRMVAAFIEVELDTKFFSLRDDPRVLIPMQRANRDGDARRLVVPELTRSKVAALMLARDDYQMGFWRNFWQSDEPMDDAVEPVPHTYATVPPPRETYPPAEAYPARETYPPDGTHTR